MTQHRPREHDEQALADTKLGKMPITASINAITAVTNPLFDIIVWAYRTWTTVTREQILDLLVHGPQHYEKWWRGLLNEAPLHILIETFLIGFIIWLYYFRSREDPKKSKRSILTEKEKKKLLETWVPEPLVPTLTPQQAAISNSRIVSRSKIHTWCGERRQRGGPGGQCCTHPR